MKTWILPISGGGFPVQIKMMGDMGYKPDVMFTASGGNVSAYMMMACNFNLNNLEEACLGIKRDMFIRGSKIGAFFRRSFLPGEGIENYMSQIFEDKDIQEIEIFTLTFDIDRIRPIVFSNRSEQNSLVKKLTQVDNLLYQTDLFHLNGDVENIAKVSLASASIPDIAPPQTILGSRYQDGGMCYASSFPPLSIRIRALLNKTRELLQMVYFGSYPLEQIVEISNEAPNKYRRTYQRIHFSVLVERADLLHFFIETVGDAKGIIIKDIEPDRIAKTLQELDKSHYLLMLYPNELYDINILDFDSKDIIETVRKTKYSGILYLQI